MAGGLLDFLATPEAALGVGLLGAASSGRGFGGGLLDAVNYSNGVRRQAQETALADQYRKAQIADLERKSRADARQQEMMAQFMGWPSPSAPAAPQAPSTPQGQATAPQTGGAAAQGGRLAQISKDYGLPIEALQADMLFNGGKKIAELISKSASPNWQNINGNLVNTNAPGFAGGMQAGMATSANGQVTAWQPDGKGGLVVGAPAGALDTYRAYQGIQSDAKPIKVYNEATGREEFVSEGSVLRGRGAQSPEQPGVSGPGYSGGSRDGANAETIRMIDAEMQQPGQRPDVIAALQRERARLVAQSGMRQSGNYAAGPSAAEDAQAAAAKTTAVEQAKADVLPTAARQAALDNGLDTLKLLDSAMEHPGMRTATGASGKIDPRNYLPGTDATNFRVLMDQIKGSIFLDAYKDLRGGGAITNVEGEKAEQAKARINRAQSTDEFMRGLRDYRAVIERGVQRMQTQAQNGGASGSWDATSKPQQREFDMLPNAQQFDGRRMKAANGTIYRSTGGRWVKE